ncbi:MAG: hypothetical protein OES28_02820, partial [Desulfobulbaceae bacterium]|nr:hypothetical protein [Desulfobulbaceae bacterium]
FTYKNIFISQPGRSTIQFSHRTANPFIREFLLLIPAMILQNRGPLEFSYGFTLALKGYWLKQNGGRAWQRKKN